MSIEDCITMKLERSDCQRLGHNISMMESGLNFDETVNKTKNPVSYRFHVSDEALRSFTCKDVLENFDGGFRVAKEICSLNDETNLRQTRQLNAQITNKDATCSSISSSTRFCSHG